MTRMRKIIHFVLVARMLSIMQLVIIFILFIIVNEINGAVVYLRPKNDRGPAATKAGVGCIEKVERIYFKNQISIQVQNLAVFHSTKMSSPSSEIEVEYLSGLHDRLLNHEEGEDNFQLKVIAETSTKQLASMSTFNDIALTDCYVVVGDNEENIFKNVKSISMSSSFNEEAKFLILFNDPENRQNGSLLSWKILNNLFGYRAVNVVVLHASDAFTYDIYTGDPYRDSANCGKMKAEMIGKCQYGQLLDYNLTKHNLMIEKVPDTMENCTFTLCARVQEPFINERCQDGLEIHIMRFLQHVMKIKVNIHCSDLDRGEIDEHGKWSDLLGEVRDDACDIVAGAFFPDHEVHADFAATEFYFQDFYTFFVRKADFAPRWIGLVTIFKVRAWTAFGAVILVSWISWFILGKFSHESSPHRQFILILFNVLAVSLGVSANNRPDLTPLRMFFSFFALYALTITAIYTSKLITVFTHPVLDYQIDTIEEILDKNFAIGGRPENEDWFDNDDEIDQLVFERYNSSRDFRPSTQNIKSIIDEGTIAIIMSKLYVKSNKLHGGLHGLSRSMFSNNLEMIVERGFPLLRKINYIISTMRDMGITEKLYHDFNYNTTILSRIKATVMQQNKRWNVEQSTQEEFIIVEDENEEEGDSRIVLSLDHLQGIFKVLVAGYVLSSSVFLFEFTLHTKFIKKIRKKLSKKCRRNVRKRQAPALAPAPARVNNTKLQQFSNLKKSNIKTSKKIKSVMDLKRVRFAGIQEDGALNSKENLYKILNKVKTSKT